MQQCPGPHAPVRSDVLAVALEANGPRAHYMRARLDTEGGSLRVTPLPDQDSSLLAPLAAADCLIVRPAHAPAAAALSSVDILRFDV